MVTRGQTLTGLGLCAFIFATIQFYLYYTHNSLHPIQLARLKSTAYTKVKTFVSLCDSTTAEIILVDPFILNEIIAAKPEDANSPCRYLCKNHIYTFALRDSDFPEFNSKVLTVMKSDGFDVSAVYVSGGMGEAGEVPTHIHLRDHEHHAIHVVVLHKRNGYWWYGPDPSTEFHMLDFTQHEGALRMFEYDFKVTLDGIQVFMPHYPQKFLEEYKNSYFIPCNHTRAAMFYRKYKKDDSKNATEFRNLAIDAIKLMKNRLDDFEVPFWLSSGTLLGWYRQCDVIPYSLDVDLGVFIKDKPADLWRTLKTTGIHLDHLFGKDEDSLQYTFKMDRIKLDIFFFYEDKENPGKVWNGGTEYSSGRKYKYSFDKFTLCWTDFYDMLVRVPCETEGYIRANYGPNWFKPVKNWVWNESPPNVEEVASWRDDELNDVIQMYDDKGRRIPLEWLNDEL